MADENKVITRGEVNALIAGVFPDNLTKAVIYNDLYTDARFIIGNNHVSGQPYGQNQALLKADIRIAAAIQVTLTPRQATIGASTTSVIFDITTAGTASVGTPEYSVVTATYDGGAPTSAVINGTQLTMTFPANTDYTSKEITARVKLTIDGREFESNLATVTQSRVEVTPTISINYTGGTITAASGSTNAFSITKNYIQQVTGFSVSPATASVTSSGQTSVTIAYEGNPGSTSRTFTVTISGRTVYGDTITDTTTFTQPADTYSLSLSPASSTVPATQTQSSIAITSNNVTNIAVSSVTGGANAEISGNNVVVTYPLNHETYDHEMTITITGRTLGGNTVTATATITQSGASSVNLSIVYTGGILPYTSGNTNNFTISANGVTVTGYTADHGATVSNTGLTQVTLNYPENTSITDTVEYEVVVGGYDEFSQPVTAHCFVTQAVAPNFEVSFVAGTAPVWSSTDADVYVYHSLVDTTTIGLNTAASDYVNTFTLGSAVGSDTYEGTVGFPPNTGSARTLKVVLTAYTEDHSEILTATTTVTQGAYTSGSGYISVTPDGTSISAAATSVTYTIEWIGLKAGTTLNFVKDSSIASIDTSSVNITAANWSGTTTVTAQVNSYPSTASGGATRNVTLTANGTGFASESLTDNGYYAQAKSRSVLTFSPTTQTGAYNATSSQDITCTTAYIPGTGNDRLHWEVTGGAYLNSSHTDTTGNTGASSGAAVTNTSKIYFDENNTTSSKEYVLTATAVGEAGETLTATFTYTHTSPAPATLTLSAPAGTVSFSGDTVTLTGTYSNIDDSTLGWDSHSSSIVGHSGISKSGGNYNLNVMLPFNTGGTRSITIYTSATTLGGETITASTVVQQAAFPSGQPDSYFITVTPDGTSITPTSQTVTYTVTWKYLKVGEQITFTKGTGLSGTASPISITNANWSSGTTTVSLTASGNSGTGARNLMLTGSTVDAAGAARRDTGYYTQAKSRSTFYFENDKSIAWDATSVTISFTYAYSSLGSINFNSTGGAFFNQQHSQSNVGVNIDAMSPQTSDSITIYFDQNTSNDNKTYTIYATGFYGEAGEVITDELEITHLSFAGASLTLNTSGSDTAPWNGGTINLVGTYTNVNENTIGIHSLSSNIPTYGTITKGSGSYNFSITIPSHTGSTRDFTIIVSATTLASGTITASTVVHQEAGVVTHDLIVTAASTSVAYNGTTQLTATYKTYVNGVETDSQNVTNSTTWTDDSSYASVSSAGVFTANNTTYNSVSVTVTGTYSGQSDTVAITVGASPYPAGSIDVQSRSDWHLDGDAGSDYFTVEWTGLKTGTSITLSTTAITSTNPTSISVTSVNGSATVNFNYSALSSGARKLVLEATGTDRNNTSRRDSDYYVQHGVGGSSGSSLSVSAVTSSPVGPDATSVTFRVTWSDVYGTITLSPSIGTASPASIEANGSNGRDITVTMGANTGSSSRTITLTGATDFNHLSGNASITQNAHVITHALVVTADSDSIAWDGTVQLTAVYKTYTDGTETGSIDVTNSTSWSDNSQYASISNSGLLTANNTTSSSITVRATGTYNGESDYVDITIGAYVPVYNPDIWWTKTSGGASSTAVNSVNDVPAFVENTYDGRNVLYTVYINYNGDVDDVSMDTSGLRNGASASRSGKTVTITAPANSGSSRSLGSIVITGTAPDGTTYDSETLSITQVSGSGAASGAFLTIENVTTYTDSVNIPASGGTRGYDVDYSYMGDIGVSGYTTATGATLNSSITTLTVGFAQNSASTSKSWSAIITGHTVFGTVKQASVMGTQSAAPSYNPYIRIEGDATHYATGTTHILDQSKTFTFSIIHNDIDISTLGTASTQSHASEHSHMYGAGVNSVALSVYLDGRTLTSIGTGYVTDYIDVSGTSLGGGTVRATLVFTIELEKVTIGWYFSNSGEPTVPANTSYQLLVDGSSVTYPGGSRVNVTYVRYSTHTVSFSANVQDTSSFPAQTVTANTLADGCVSPNEFPMEVYLPNYGPHTSTTQNVRMDSDGDANVSFNWQQTYVFSLTTTQAGCTVVMNGVTATTSSQANHAYTVSSVNSSVEYSVSKTGYYTKSGTIYNSSPNITVTLDEIVSTYETISMSNNTMSFSNRTSSSIMVQLTVNLVRDSDGYTIGTWTQTGVSSMGPGGSASVTPYFPSSSSATAQTNTSLSVKYTLQVSSGNVSNATFECGWNGTSPSVTGYFSGGAIEATCSLGTLSPHKTTPWPFPESSFGVIIS